MRRKEVQKTVDALVAELTAAVMRVVRETLRARLAAKRPAAPAGRAGKRRSPDSRAKPTRPPRKKAAKPKREARSTTRLRSVEQMEQLLVRHLRGGVLLGFDDLGSVGASGEAPLIHAAVERLVARGLIGVTGEGSERFVFATRGRPVATKERRSTPAPAAEAPPSRRRSTPTPAAPTSAGEIATAPQASAAEGAAPAAPSGPPAGHPFVVRRKRSA